MIDSYSSHPDYFQKVEPHVARKHLGSSEKYAPFLDNPKDIQKLGELFDTMRGTVLCTTNLPDQYTKLLGLTDILTSYEYLQDFEETDGIEQWDQFIHVQAFPTESCGSLWRKHLEAETWFGEYENIRLIPFHPDQRRFVITGFKPDTVFENGMKAKARLACIPTRF